MDNKIQKGKAGELSAENFLIKKGYEIVARNYRHKRSEIDLIAKQDNWLVFVEVRLRNSAAFGFPEQTISANKKTKLMEGAAHFLEESNWKGNVRYDIIAIFRNQISHFEDAFY